MDALKAAARVQLIPLNLNKETIGRAEFSPCCRAFRFLGEGTKRRRRLIVGREDKEEEEWSRRWSKMGGEAAN